MAILLVLEIILADTRQPPESSYVNPCADPSAGTVLPRRRGFGSTRINYIFQDLEPATLHAGYPW
jgi:hypothetical protein